MEHSPTPGLKSAPTTLVDWLGSQYRVFSSAITLMKWRCFPVEPYMISLFRVLLGITAGVLTIFFLVMAVEIFSAVVHPLPDDFDNSPEAMCQHVAHYPDWVLGIVVLLWGSAAFSGVWLAQKAGSYGASTVVAVLLLAALGFNLSMLPYTPWFKVVMPGGALAAIAMALRAARSKPAPHHEIANA